MARKRRVSKRSGVGFLILVLAAALAAVRMFGGSGAAVGEKTLPESTVTNNGEDFQVYDQREFAVVHVVDGDTLDIAVKDRTTGKAKTRVRLWGVDTPETASSPQGAKHYGEDAKAFAKAAAEGKRVQIRLEPKKKNRDRYGRLLGYVFLDDGTMLNERLIAEGYAFAEERFEHVYKERFLELAARAKKEKAGLWEKVRWEDLPEWYQKRHEEEKK